MTEPFIPFDATDDEIAALYVVREGIPDTLRPPLAAWVIEAVSDQWGFVNTEMAHAIQSNVRVSFGIGPVDRVKAIRFFEAIQQRGDAIVLRVVDYLLTLCDLPDQWGNVDSTVEILKYHLDLNRSAYEVYINDGDYRLRHRIPEGVEELVQKAIDLGDVAGKHLANAWHAAFDLTPNETHAMTEAIRAVEAASGPVVVPNDKKPTMGKVTNAIRDQGGWNLVLQTSDGYPDQKAVLTGMLETLAKAQQDRHSGTPPTTLEAQAHVQLAATLVFWFSSGAVVRTQ